MFSEFFTLEMLVTFAGCTLAVGVITEMFKKIGFLLHVPNQLISYVVALIILVFGNLALGTFNIANAFMCLINAAVISLASNGGYDLVSNVAQIGEDHATVAEIEDMVALEEAAHDPTVDNG